MFLLIIDVIEHVLGSENVESWIAMQLKELNTQGYEVILVSSGAVGLGRQRLRYRKLVNSRYLLLPFLGKTSTYEI